MDPIEAIDAQAAEQKPFDWDMDVWEEWIKWTSDKEVQASGTCDDFEKIIGKPF